MHWMDLYLYYIYIYIYSSIHPDPSCIQLLENLLAAVSLLKFETPLLKIYLSKYKLCLNCSAFGYKSRVFHSGLSLELLNSCSAFCRSLVSFLFQLHSC